MYKRADVKATMTASCYFLLPSLEKNMGEPLLLLQLACPHDHTVEAYQENQWPPETLGAGYLH